MKRRKKLIILMNHYHRKRNQMMIVSLVQLMVILSMLLSIISSTLIKNPQMKLLLKFSILVLSLLMPKIEKKKVDLNPTLRNYSPMIQVSRQPSKTLMK